MRKASAEAGLLEASGCGPEELPLATQERDAAALQPFFSFAACACCNDADCDAVLDLPEGGFFCGECANDVTNAERVEQDAQAALDGRAAAAAQPTPTPPVSVCEERLVRVAKFNPLRYLSHLPIGSKRSFGGYGHGTIPPATRPTLT